MGNSEKSLVIAVGYNPFIYPKLPLSGWRDVLPCLAIAPPQGVDRRGVLRLVGVILSIDSVELSRALFQDYHLLRGHIAFSLQRIEVGTTGYPFTSISLTIPIDRF